MRFQEEDLRRFSSASLDLNPLHLSRSYARKTHIGDLVVHNALAAAFCIAQLPVRHSWVPASLRIEYAAPLLLGVDYAIKVTPHDDGKTTVAMTDGSVTMVRVQLAWQKGEPRFVEFPTAPLAPLAAARRLDAADFRPGSHFASNYSPSLDDYLGFLKVCGLDRKKLGDTLPLTLLWSSYATGMEMPGERSLDTSLKADFPAARVGAPFVAPFAYRLSAESWDDHADRLQSQFSLSTLGRPFASGEIGAVLRPAREPLDISLSRDEFAEFFRGKTAWITGASRGLGAMLAAQLVTAGARVVGTYAHSRDEAMALMSACENLPGSLSMEQADAADASWWQSRSDAKADLLICNAAPALRPMHAEPAYEARIRAYIDKGLTMVTAPVFALQNQIASRDGFILLISSSAVERPPRNWPHYVAMKMAAEEFLRAQAASNHGATYGIARPGMMKTDFVAGAGRKEARDPAEVARNLLKSVVKNWKRGGVAMISDGRNLESRLLALAGR